jgi:hypothetical protein
MDSPQNHDTKPGRARTQTATAVLMVRPASFGWNAETQPSNRFQRAAGELEAAAQSRAAEEFDGLVARLRDAGVAVVVAEDDVDAACPDAVFPNNWVSLHADGTVVLYPMLAPSRRRERRLQHLTMVERVTTRRVTRLLDLTHYESRGLYLEGTGSIVFDHPARVAYAALSPRTHVEPLHDLCGELGYEPCVFGALDACGVAIYHTNVMLAIGARFAVIVAESIEPARREDVLRRLRATGRDVIEIDVATMGRFAANVLELRATDGAGVLALSQTAAEAFGRAGLGRLQRSVDRIVTAPIPTVETLGGGSVRCMLAEVFLPG